MSFLKTTAITALLTAAVTLSAQAAENNRLNINQASANEIDQTLVFVSEQTAQKIVDYRKENGNFSNLNDLASVVGVSKRLARYNRSRISFE